MSTEVKKIKVKLVTRCGCEKEMTIADNPNIRRIVVPLMDSRYVPNNETYQQREFDREDNTTTIFKEI